MAHFTQILLKLYSNKNGKFYSNFNQISLEIVHFTQISFAIAHLTQISLEMAHFTEIYK